MKLFISSLLITLCISVSIAHADIIKLPGQSPQVLQLQNTPVRGMQMTQVLKKFGKAKKTHPAVGQPTITRWEYHRYDVYFEGDHVIHTVAHKHFK